MLAENSFRTTSKIEDLWMPYLEGYFLERFGIHFFVVGPGTTPGHRALQEICDVIAWDMLGTRLIEVKFDEYESGNLFAETWSNRTKGNRGWFYKCLATELVYAFPLMRVAYVGELKKIRACVMEHINDFPEVEQKQYRQLNDAWGRLVPAQWLERKGVAVRHNLEKHIPAEVVQARKTEKAVQRFAGRKEAKTAPTHYRGADLDGRRVIVSASSS